LRPLDDLLERSAGPRFTPVVLRVVRGA